MKITGSYSQKYPGGYKSTKSTEKVNQQQINQEDEQQDLISQKTESSSQPENAVVISIGIAGNRGKAKQSKKDKEQKALEELQNMQSQYQMLVEQMENSKKQAEAMGEALKVRMNCLLIAIRIMCGDEVPRADYQYLSKHYPEMLAKALMMRIEKENPKKHKRVSEDEEELNSDAERADDSSSSKNINIAIASAESSGGEAQSEAGSATESESVSS